jgi:hypothetical protein
MFQHSWDGEEEERGAGQTTIMENYKSILKKVGCKNLSILFFIVLFFWFVFYF